MSSSSIIPPAVEQATTPMSPERLGEIDARAAHLYEYVQQPAEADVLAGQDVPELLAEVDRLRAQVAAVRAFATSHKYRWLHNLLDGGAA